ncbi:hypothetical protein CS063_06620 [Sporanaerobium hydrogeniformans]|uniref:Uncharacterized protein n=1 Tax=Sporanaerobium hydrogeniformans TaxID=3072179 RepID=A0AC61DEN1_9FIRM|nr:hypothetical protein [Sporanaerobium hydrogeniformans]PHV71360.1 hypothetical protein CS063_06620 [Sporanaerobium hydrogeniformans]
MKEKLLQALWQLTLAQEKALEDDEIEEFEKFLNQKETLIHQLKVVREKEGMDWSETEKQLVKKLQEVDARMNTYFQQELEATKKEIGKIRNQKKVAHFYNHPYSTASEEGIFIDKRRT